ncbi:MAG: excinuclease ABC subunit A [Candidatus Moranbacteria bacterium RIFCSPHIGHO2_02_FULL_40_12b]|nr:MAG: excinuclease ABC subunit A [Candidatus Moranbacteria bacterium RIFCSPHIGHO2_02_FULL_40_12b]
MDKRDKIIIRGARVNNLKNINIDIPRDKFVVITGLSGSGKSSLAFDTIFAEGNRRYMEGFSSYARNFLPVTAKPDVDRIDNLSPAISIDQKSISRSPRSTVGTLTEIYDLMRVLFAKIGVPHCPNCRAIMSRKSNKEILEELLSQPDRSQIIILASEERREKDARDALRKIQQMGYARVRFNGKIMTTSEALLISSDVAPSEAKIVVDRITLNFEKLDRERLLDSIETAMKIGKGSITVLIDNEKELLYNKDFLCWECGVRLKEITPRHFSFNSPEGACPACSGLGIKLKIDPNLLIPNKNLTLSEGAIHPWSKSGGKINGQSSYLSVLKIVADKYFFSTDIPVKKMDSRHLDIVLYGVSGKGIPVEIAGDMGGVRKTYVFEGVIPGLLRKYNESKSDYLRKEIEKYMVSEICDACGGKRLKKEYLSVTVFEKSIDELANYSVVNLKNLFSESGQWEQSAANKKIIQYLSKEITERLSALEGVGLEYLNMARSAETISGGEAQRIRLAVQIKSELMGIIYILDEPTIGLHSRDTEKLIKTIRTLRDSGNSLVVVEHDKKIMQSADWIVDMGPGAGEDGGRIIFEGDYKKLLKSKTKTADYLSGRKKVFEKNRVRQKNGGFIEVVKPEENNLKGMNVRLPLGKFVVMCGVSGSGKSTLVNDILAKSLSRHFFGSKDIPGKHKAIKNIGSINKVININQDPIGRTPRSNAATYTGVFSHIREVFAGAEESKSRSYASSQFSFNMKGGRCEVCQGEGYRKIEMHLLPDMYVKCESCGGTRYNSKTLEVEYQGMNIAQVLDMSIGYAMKFFKKHPLIYDKLRMMEDVGLGYLRLGQSATDLSGGEAQRIKLATELARKSTGKTLYILDEPTIGLHFEDTKCLLGVLDALVEKGNSVLVVEHNPDVIKSADWVIELGPEGGEKGGYVVFEGTPEKLAKSRKSWTGKYL